LQTEAQDNPFVSKKSSKEEIRLPTFASQIFAKILSWQRQLNTKLTQLVKRLKTDMSWGALWPLVAISFLYGIVHAAGPGHGKVVVFSYFLSRRANIKKGLLLGNLISLFHGLSGIITVLALYFIIKTACLSSFEAISQKIKLLSYSLVMVIGMVLLMNSLFKIIKSPSPSLEKDAVIMSPDHSGVLLLALAVGMIPCPGVVIIMLFALSFDLLTTGGIMSLIMSLGMAVSLSLSQAF
jgi:ABC-type nickel/cobalt efflux system permease component RcnA